MNENQSSNHAEQIEKRPAHFKFSLFSSLSDVWILAIALLILLFISFISERQTYPPSFKQIQDISGNNFSIKKFSTGINKAITENKAGIVRKKIEENKINKDFFGLG